MFHLQCLGKTATGSTSRPIHDTKVSSITSRRESLWVMPWGAEGRLHVEERWMFILVTQFVRYKDL
jgi:hypothetical protein